jgi:hypothetical protein
MAAFGLPFFAAGLFMLLVVSGIVPVSNPGEMPRFGWLVMLFMGLAFTGVGGMLAFGRSWTTLDTSQRLVIKQWGLLLPFRQRTYPLTGYTAVTLGFVEGDSDTSDRFPVGVKDRTGQSLPLCSSTTYATSRECALAVARHLRLDIEDATTDHQVRLSPSEAERSLRQRTVDFTPEVEVARPPTARSEVSRDAGGVRIVIPHPRVHPLALAAGLIPLAIPFVLVPWFMEFFRRTRTPEPIGWVFIASLTFMFGLLPALVVLNAFLRSRRGGTIVTVSGTGIDIHERGAWMTRPTATLEAADILDVDYSTRESAAAFVRVAAEQQAMESTGATSPSVGPRAERLLAWAMRFAKARGLTVKTRTGLSRFGAGLDDEEIRYLYSVVRRALQRGV